MKATLIATRGPWLEAILKTESGTFTVMDEFSMDERSAPAIGSQFEVDLSVGLLEDQSWESIFASNPEKIKGIEQIKGWRYSAFGEVVSIDPVAVDCGLILVEDVFYTKDPRVIGDYVGFIIARLDAS